MTKIEEHCSRESLFSFNLKGNTYDMIVYQSLLKNHTKEQLYMTFVAAFINIHEQCPKTTSDQTTKYF